MTTMELTHVRLPNDFVGFEVDGEFTAMDDLPIYLIAANIMSVWVDDVSEDGDVRAVVTYPDELHGSVDFVTAWNMDWRHIDDFVKQLEDELERWTQ